MFVGAVSLKEGTIELYSTLRINEAAAAMETQQILARKGTKDGVFGWRPGGDGVVEVWLGPPVASWTVRDLDASATSRQKCYEVLEAFLPQDRQQQARIALRASKPFTWETNLAGAYRAATPWAKSTTGRTQEILDIVLPGLNALVMDDLVSQDTSGAVLTAVHSLAEAIAKVAPHDDLNGLATTALVLRDLRKPKPKKDND